MQTLTISIGKFVNMTSNFNDQVGTYINSFGSYDELREIGGFIFFIVPLIWLVFPLVGVLLFIFTGNDEESRDNNCLAKICFKFNWCLAMYLGTTVMLILSLFAVITVLWADLCVQLDDFERNLGESGVGKLLANLTGDTAQFDFVYDIVNACFYGTSILELFNLSDILDWDQYRDEVSGVLDIDITSLFEISEIESFESELDILDATTFTYVTDEAIDDANAHDPNCFCPTVNLSLSQSPPAAGIPFTRALLQTDICVGSGFDENDLDPSNYDDFRDIYWIYQLQNDEDCLTKFSLAYGYVRAEDTLNDQINQTIFGVKQGGQKIFSAYDDIYSIAVDLEGILVDISCSLDPLFNSFDVIITQYDNCGLFGQAYGGFKNVGCELLFSDMYYITRGMAIIAFLSILVALFSICMDYVVAPRFDVIDDDDAIFKAAVQSEETAGNTSGVEMQHQGRASWHAGAGGGDAFTTQPGGGMDAGNEGPGAGAGPQFV